VPIAADNLDELRANPAWRAPSAPRGRSPRPPLQASEGELTYRAAVAVAERLGTEPVIFPSHHAGFLGGEFGMQGEPEAFAATLRQVLAEDG
jgi:hypothetical protein